MLKQKVFVLQFLILSPFIVFANTPQFSQIPCEIPMLYGLSGRCANPEFVDLDNDFDLILSEYDEINGRYYLGMRENTGSTIAPVFVEAPIKVCSIRGAHPIFADLDDDHDLDMIAVYIDSLGQQRLDYFRNETQDTSLVFCRIDSLLPPIADATAPLLVDINEDGGPDLLVLTSAGELYYIDNLSPLAVDPAEPVVSSPVLYQNYPNPFNPTTTIGYQLPHTGYVELSVYNMLGQKITTLVSEKQRAGSYNIRWDDSALASGVFLYRLKTDDFVITKTMLLIR